jgi:hypothetical protein
MSLPRSAFVLVAGMAITAGPTLGHHPLAAEYDLQRSVTVTGTVTKFEWVNPHVRLNLNASERDRRRDIMQWEFEMASPNLMVLNGFKIDSFRPGDQVTVTAYPARDGSKLGFAWKISRGHWSR